jgi:hypothetical protein
MRDSHMRRPHACTAKIEVSKYTHHTAPKSMVKLSGVKMKQSTCTPLNN